jgi:glycosidase
MGADLLHQKATHFVLWRPRQTMPPPRLIIGKLRPGNPPTLIDVRRFDLQPSPRSSDLWEIPLAACYLADGEVYHVEGVRHERLFNFLQNMIDTERRIKLAFICLLTAVGVPRIFAGEEFADEHDLPVRHPEKQADPVNFDRAKETWRQRVLHYMSCLVKFRTTCDALSVNDTDFIHTDFHEGKRVVVWRRGHPGNDALVVVVANFPDYGRPEPLTPHAESVVPHWPAIPPGKWWREITQDRLMPPQWVGREPIFPWEAKVYALS